MFTRKVRQQIVEDFAKRHGGEFDAALFVSEVRRRGASHPAHSWFTWDDTEAAHEHRLWQARSFVRDLVVKFEIEEVGRSGKITIVQTEMPLVLSPLAGRPGGGGYFLSNPNDPGHMSTLCGEAATSLRSWLKRYGATLVHVGASGAHFERVADLLDDV